MKKFLISSATLLAISFCPPLLAKVELSQKGDRIVISSDNLDFGPSPDVKLHDDFESGSPGEVLQNWSVSASGGTGDLPRYANEFAVTGKSSGMSSFLGRNYNSSAEFKELGGLRTVYLSYYVKIDQLSGEPSRNIKLARLSGGYKGGTYNQAIGLTFFHNYNNGALFQASRDHSTSKVPTKWMGNYVDSQWHRIEYYVKLSTPGKEDGVTLTRINGNKVVELHDIENDEVGIKYEWLSLPYFVSHDPGGDYKIYYDNVVVSKNMARIELCEHASYSKCQQPILAKVINWAPNKIEILAETLSGKNPYIFIFNEDDGLINRSSINVTYKNWEGMPDRNTSPQSGIYFCPECPRSPEVDGPR